MNFNKKNILLTGASGAVGQEVLSQLITDPSFRITVFDRQTRHSTKTFRRYKNDINIIYGDISKKEDVEKATYNIDAVIHLAAVIPPLADHNPGLAYEVNVSGTRNLLEAVKRNSPQAFFMYASSISVYGDRINSPMISTEDTLNPCEHDHYAHTKIEAEKLVTDSSLSWTIFRLSAVMGYRNHKMSGLMFEMPLDTPMEIVTPHDTGKAFVSAIHQTEELKGQIFNLGGGDKNRLTYREFLSRSFRIYGLKKPDFPEYAFAAKNFHCGYYCDGDRLNEILHFRNDTIKTYFSVLHEQINPAQRFFTSLFNRFIKKYFLRKSLPYLAFVKKDPVLLERFF